MLELEKPGCGSVAMRIGGAVVSKSWLRKLPSKWKVKLGTGYKISPGCQGVDATGLCAASLSSRTNSAMRALSLLSGREKWKNLDGLVLID